MTTFRLSCREYETRFLEQGCKYINKLYRVSQKPLDTRRDMLNVECQVAFAPLCIQVIHKRMVRF
jgi:hypothetical protein